MNDLLTHFVVAKSYTNGWLFVGPVIVTSPNWDNNNEVIFPPPPDPPTFLNIPPGNILYDVLSVKSALFLTVMAPKYTAFCFVFSTSWNCSYVRLAAASISFVYVCVP
jgi:hypothetical protein